MFNISEEDRKKVANKVVQMVVEQEDLSSPEDYEEFAFVKPERLHQFVLAAIEEVSDGA